MLGKVQTTLEAERKENYELLHSTLKGTLEEHRRLLGVMAEGHVRRTRPDMSAVNGQEEL